MKTASKIALVILVFVVLASVFANFIAPHNPLEIFNARQAPGNGFIFGTDDKGRDILSRMLHGGQYSLVIGFGATGMALLCGSIIGAIALQAPKRGPCAVSDGVIFSCAAMACVSFVLVQIRGSLSKHKVWAGV